MIELHFSGKISFNNTKSYILLKNKKLEILKSRAKYAYAMHADTLFQLPKTTQKRYFLAEFQNSHFGKLLYSNTEAIWGPNFGLSFRLSSFSDTYSTSQEKR